MSDDEQNRLLLEACDKNHDNMKAQISKRIKDSVEKAKKKKEEEAHDIKEKNRKLESELKKCEAEREQYKKSVEMSSAQRARNERFVNNNKKSIEKHVEEYHRTNPVDRNNFKTFAFGEGCPEECPRAKKWAKEVKRRSLNGSYRLKETHQYLFRPSDGAIVKTHDDIWVEDYVTQRGQHYQLFYRDLKKFTSQRELVEKNKDLQVRVLQR